MTARLSGVRREGIRPEPVPLAWLTVSGGPAVAATSNPWTYSPQLGLTILGAWVATCPRGGERP